MDLVWSRQQNNERDRFYIMQPQKYMYEDVSVTNQFNTCSDHRLVQAKKTINAKMEKKLATI